MTHTRTLVLARVNGEAEVAAFAHGRAVRGAVSTGLGGTVRAIAYVDWPMSTHTHTHTHARALMRIRVTVRATVRSEA